MKFPEKQVELNSQKQVELNSQQILSICLQKLNQLRKEL